MKPLYRIASIGLAVLTLSAPSLTAAEPLLHYPLNEGKGTIAKDEGSARIDLDIGSGMGWSMKDEGVGGAQALGCVSDKNVYASSSEADGKLPEKLVSYTMCGWYKQNELNAKAGVLMDLPSFNGNGFQLHFSRRDDEKTRETQGTLVLAVTPQGGNPHGGPGVQYSTWGEPFGKTGEWVFFAVTVNTLAEENQIVFYAGTESKPVRPRGGAWTPTTLEALEAFIIGNVSEVWLANNGSAIVQRPLDLGTYVNDFRFYGSETDGTGALTSDDLEIIRQEGASH